MICQYTLAQAGLSLSNAETESIIILNEPYIHGLVCTDNYLHDDPLNILKLMYQQNSVFANQ